jgi:hypothetical protein
LGVTPEYQGVQHFIGDYVYWVGRDGMGYTSGFRQLLNGNRPDPLQQKERLRRHELPSELLRREYDVLYQGGVPNEEFRSPTKGIYPATEASLR